MPSSLRTLLDALKVPMLALTLAAATVPCAAQLRLDVMPDTTWLSTQRQTSPTSTDNPLQASGGQAFFATSRTNSTWLGNAIELEAPRATTMGQYTRPKFHVGVPSESMRGFLNSAGFSAEKCQLPMVRARTKSNGDGDINGTLWLYARCTFR